MEDFDIKNIRQPSLPASVLIKNYVEGYEIDYEKYLTDFINVSKLIELNNNELFKWIPHNEQSHGECDLYGENYSLDFKLLSEPKFMEGKSTLSYTYSIPTKGVVLMGPSKRSGVKNFGYYDMVKVFRSLEFKGLPKEDLYNEIDPEKIATIHVLNNASKDKNLLFFLPNEYYYKNQETTEEIARFITSNIVKDLKSLLEYRKTKTDKDTFIGYKSKGKFVIAKVNENGVIENYPLIDTKVSKAFTYLYEFK